MSRGIRQFFLGMLIGLVAMAVPLLPLVAVVHRLAPEVQAALGPDLAISIQPETAPEPEGARQLPAPADQPASTPSGITVPEGVELPAGVTFGDPLSAGLLTVRPLRRADAPLETEYLTLEEAMESGLCTVTEAGPVNALLASNKGTKPVFAMAGDLLLGGKQDRVLASSMVLEAGAADVQVPVCCVERGRWATQHEDAPRIQSPQRFYKDSRRSTVDLKVKGAAALGDQDAVWSNVAQVSRQVAAADPKGTGSFRCAYAAPAASSAEDIVARLSAATPVDTVGFAVFESSELVALDVFDSLGLCRKVRDKVLRSYAMTALSGGTAARRVVIAEDERIVEDARDGINEHPADRPFRDLAENPNDDPSCDESPRAGSSIGLAGGIGGGGRQAAQNAATGGECIRQVNGRRAHLSYVRR